MTSGATTAERNSWKNDTMPAPTDLPTDPELLAQLLLARRATAFFAHELNGLSNVDLDEDSLLPGWTRRHVIAHIAHNARGIVRLVTWARTGVETPMYASNAARDRDIAEGAELDRNALRTLFDVSTVQLDAAWRRLPPEAWSNTVRTPSGREIPVSETVWMRNQELWVHTIDLATGAAFDDVPAEILERLLTNITAGWAARGEDTDLVLAITAPDAERSLGDLDADSPVVVSGSLAGLVRWATGRGGSDVSSSAGTPADPPRWL
jgi:maleylpyruvate isomerase